MLFLLERTDDWLIMLFEIDYCTLIDFIVTLPFTVVPAAAAATCLFSGMS